MIIAIDGVSASGKSSTAKLLAKKINFIHFSTGKMYRALTAFLIDNNLFIDFPNRIIEIINSIDIVVKGKSLNNIYINGVAYEEKCYTLDVTKNVSDVSAIFEVRTKMVSIQKEIGLDNNLVCEGRDIGSTVFPNAEFKFFFDADIETRAIRRFKELSHSKRKIELSDIRNRLINRDYIDINRKISPLVKCDDAIVVNTTKMTLEEQVEFIYNIIKLK